MREKDATETGIRHRSGFGTKIDTKSRTRSGIGVTKSVLVDEAKKVCGVNKRTNVTKKDNECLNFEVRKVVSKKKKAWLDLLSAKTNHRVQRKDILKDKLKDAERKISEMLTLNAKLPERPAADGAREPHYV
ncbi:hypothetical protein EVAR_20332_1 [Eumeta japonica]|uniref:Uncharacterized protein n=1 Tax=Eumeta variegata TaxID=151549 RepID=A0A4C1VT76_EUMVA|nr:hypothetical protein EVAR_20332_1 [Eumeta japonica]